MTAKLLSVMTVFIASLLIGWNTVNITEEVKAMPIPTPIEMPRMNLPLLANSVQKSADVDVNIDLESNKVSVKGTADTKVNITQKEKIVTKYKTRIRRDTIVVATHPIVKMSVPEMPSLKKSLGYELKEYLYTSPNDYFI